MTQEEMDRMNRIFWKENERLAALVPEQAQAFADVWLMLKLLRDAIETKDTNQSIN